MSKQRRLNEKSVTFIDDYTRGAGGVQICEGRKYDEKADIWSLG